MIAILSLLLEVTLSILVTRVASIALTHTGLARQSARFQVRSAFSGAGFTTAESEQVVNHPVRRRIVLTLMLLGNAGIVTAVSSLILAFVQDGDAGMPLEIKVLLLVGGLVLLWAGASTQAFQRALGGGRPDARATRTRTSVTTRACCIRPAITASSSWRWSPAAGSTAAPLQRPDRRRRACWCSECLPRRGAGSAPREVTRASVPATPWWCTPHRRGGGFG